MVSCSPLVPHLDKGRDASSQNKRGKIRYRRRGMWTDAVFSLFLNFCECAYARVCGFPGPRQHLQSSSAVNHFNNSLCISAQTNSERRFDTGSFQRLVRTTDSSAGAPNGRWLSLVDYFRSRSMRNSYRLHNVCLWSAHVIYVGEIFSILEYCRVLLEQIEAGQTDFFFSSESNSQGN